MMLAGPALAQPFNYGSALVGEQAVGLGGAFTGLADDASALWYNPAGLAQMSRAGLSLSASTYGYFSSIEKGAFRDEDTIRDVAREGSFSVPNAIIYALPIGESGGLQHTLAAGVFVPYRNIWKGSMDISLEEERTEQYDRDDNFISIDDTEYRVGFGYAAQLGNLYLGAGLFFSYFTSQREEANAYTYGDEESAYRIQAFTSSAQSQLAITGDVGALWRPAPLWRIGLKIGLPNARLWSASSFNHHRTEIGSELRDDTSQALNPPRISEAFQDTFRGVEGQSRYKRPGAIAFGVSRGKPRHFTVSADLRVFMPVAPFERIEVDTQKARPAPGEIVDPLVEPGFRDFDPSETDGGRALTVNGAIGIRVPVTDSLELLLGAYTDFSANRDEVDQLESTDRYGGSLALRTGTSAESLTLGLTGFYGMGEGESVDLSESSQGPAQSSQITEWSVAFFLAGSTPFGE